MKRNKSAGKRYRRGYFINARNGRFQTRSAHQKNDCSNLTLFSSQNECIVSFRKEDRQQIFVSRTAQRAHKHTTSSGRLSRRTLREARRFEQRATDVAMLLPKADASCRTHKPKDLATPGRQVQPLSAADDIAG